MQHENDIAQTLSTNLSNRCPRKVQNVLNSTPRICLAIYRNPDAVLECQKGSRILLLAAQKRNILKV